jgi:hypothetical protein
MISSLNTSSSTIGASIFIVKFLIAPFKQLEVYLKYLKEIERYTPDHHIDRGDVQRSIQFYSELLMNVNEMRKKKEHEIDIMTSKINNADEVLLTTVFFLNVSPKRKLNFH